MIQRFVEAGCGCDEVAAHLISIDEALSRIAREASPATGHETVAVGSASGRVLAQSVRAEGHVPPFDNAAMDGYAIRTGDLLGAGPWTLPIKGRIAAGQATCPVFEKGAAIQIFTGAPMPYGADAVVMQEHVHRDGDTIRVDHAAFAGAHVRRAGEDMTKGQMIVPEGRRLGARDIAACAAAGASRVRVSRPVRIALLVTGDEVARAGTALSRAGIRDVNTPMLFSAISETGGAECSTHRGADSRDALRAQITELAATADLVITTGGISVGEEDHVKAALADLGARIVFSGVAVKPGKPVSFGQLESALWLGLPGNPLSAYLTWTIFGPAILAALSNQDDWQPRRRFVVTDRPLRRRPGRCELRLAKVAGVDSVGRDIVQVEDATHSGRVAGLPEAEGFILLPSDTDSLPEGALVEFQPFCQR
ncbi:gephyrin-like molybdotransferase Glp [Marimonas sp. MJW-29]|uniref:Molybdopterin molybdenumtransferase n=1 Tax=Sulfitobacter sediminis TaxID=3234186 RepID=A0ABV3RQL3_9RHOB